ncbi:MAG: hypothetical protein HYY84_20105 [Deltaproteobacteria bacterium]|nr:hypothetical protein [Deltaproteobacteria bacterium]
MQVAEQALKALRPKLDEVSRFSGAQLFLDVGTDFLPEGSGLGDAGAGAGYPVYDAGANPCGDYPDCNGYDNCAGTPIDDPRCLDAGTAYDGGWIWPDAGIYDAGH